VLLTEPPEKIEKRIQTLRSLRSPRRMRFFLFPSRLCVMHRNIYVGVYLDLEENKLRLIDNLSSSSF